VKFVCYYRGYEIYQDAAGLFGYRAVNSRSTAPGRFHALKLCTIAIDEEMFK